MTNPSQTPGTSTGSSFSSSSAANTTSNTSSTFLEKVQQHPYIAAGAGVALLVHLSALLSLPPAIRGKGAPYLPTSQKHSLAMFQQLHRQLSQTQSKAIQTKLATNQLTFCDLGSGDGRLVFRAAREGIFQNCIGYEINPVLHAFAHLRRLIQAPQYWSKTQFFLRDIWKVDLCQVDVVAVYGLTPIMRPLGVKLQSEMAPGSIVLSNVFSIPNWKPVATSAHGTHIYVVPKQSTKITTPPTTNA